MDAQSFPRILLLRVEPPWRLREALGWGHWLCLVCEDGEGTMAGSGPDQHCSFLFTCPIDLVRYSRSSVLSF